MEIYQLIYTSCRKGLDGGSGFQVHSMSQCISESERKEIESHCVYIPPMHLPARPTREEIETLFPRTFSYFRLSSGKYGAACIRYSGSDYSGRYGNYFCHVLLWDGSLPMPPVSLYNSSSFRNELAEEADPAPLKMLYHVEPGDTLSFDNVMEFTIYKRENVREFMNKVLLAYMEDRKVVFTCEDKDLPFYVGAAHMLVPHSISKDFSFTTYTQQIDNLKYFISAVLEEGAGYSKYKLEKGLGHYFINLKTDVQAEGLGSIYTDILFSMETAAQMGAVMDFVSRFNPEKVTDLHNPALIYGLMKGIVQDVDQQIVEETLRRALKVLDLDSLKNLWDMMYIYLKSRNLTLPLEGRDSAMLSFLSKCTGIIKDDELNEMLFVLVLSIADSTIEQGKTAHSLVDIFTRAYAERVPQSARWSCYTSRERVMGLYFGIQSLPPNAVFYHASKYMEYLNSAGLPMKDSMAAEGLEELLYNLFYILAEQGRAGEALAPLENSTLSFIGFNIMMYEHFKNSIYKDCWMNIIIDWLEKRNADERRLLWDMVSCDYLKNMIKSAASEMDRAQKLYNILYTEVFCSMDKDTAASFREVSCIYINEVLKRNKFKGNEYKWENMLDICSKKFQWFEPDSMINLCISVEDNIEGSIFSNESSSLYNPIFYYTKHRDLLRQLIGLQIKCGIHRGKRIADILFLLYQGDIDSLIPVLGECFEGRTELKYKFILHMTAGLLEYMGDEVPYHKLSLMLIDNMGQQDFWPGLSDIICSSRYDEDKILSRMLCLRLILCSTADKKDEGLYKWLDNFLVKVPPALQKNALSEMERVLSGTGREKAQYIWDEYRKNRGLNKKSGIINKVFGFLK